MTQKSCGFNHHEHLEGSKEYDDCKREAERLEKLEASNRLHLHRLLMEPPAAAALDPTGRQQQELEGMKAEESVVEQLSRLANRPPLSTSDAPNYEM
ncbi:hypothetical protein [Williamsia sp. 1135]|uniref:hypothetical protein n=1 Tax=Williamsia sp. 1135 TaxID=1889262 RepID=UPI000A1084A3|nr:hypothetical protein [Williamsia sp. 1135]ORM38128.1 hypothetical protein BFL43_01180 [Williamsia sp. 1135]